MALCAFRMHFAFHVVAGPVLSGVRRGFSWHLRCIPPLPQSPVPPILSDDWHQGVERIFPPTCASLLFYPRYPRPCSLLQVTPFSYMRHSPPPLPPHVVSHLSPQAMLNCGLYFIFYPFSVIFPQRPVIAGSLVDDVQSSFVDFRETPGRHAVLHVHSPTLSPRGIPDSVLVLVSRGC